MKIAARVQCSPTDARRLLGGPDLLPLYQLAAELLERWLMQRIAMAEVGNPAPSADTADDRGRAQATARRPA